MNKKSNVLVIIPAYNEEANIKRVIDDLAEYCPQYDIVVINDCSTDGTEKMLKDFNIPYVSLPINLGIGGCVQTGYRYAREWNYDVAVQFDGDGQHMAEYVGTIVAPVLAKNADFTIGSRFLEKQGFQSSRMRRIGISFLSGLLRTLCGVKISDVTSGMRAVNRGLIELFADNYSRDYPEPEAILEAVLHDYRVHEVPVRMRERVGGVSSINFLRSNYYMIKVSLGLIISRLTYRRKRRT